MPKSEGYVSADYLRKSAELAAKPKQRSYELMLLARGSRVLDLGCGPGMDTIPMAKMVGESGSVIGLDLDEEMLAQANRYAIENRVDSITKHQQGSAQKVDFPNNHFDAVRAERLLQVLPRSISASSVVDEMVRVCKPGGRVVLLDGDWGSFSVEFSNCELENRLTGFFASNLRPNGYAGRQLYGIAKRAGLTNIDIELFPMAVLDYEQVPVGDWLQGEAKKAGIASENEINAWRSELQRKSEQGEFFCLMTMVLVAGTKPKG